MIWPNRVDDSDALATRKQDEELFRWGIGQQQFGWQKLDAEAEHEMRLQHVQPDTWIVPPRFLIFSALGTPTATEFYRAGDEAKANLRKGSDNFATFRGKKVFETKPYALEGDGNVIGPLTRERVIGDYFIDYPDTGQPQTAVYCCANDKFSSMVLYQDDGSGPAKAQWPAPPGGHAGGHAGGPPGGHAGGSPGGPPGGPRGPTGPQGPKGNTGLQGPKCFTGLRGRRGETAPSCPHGPLAPLPGGHTYSCGLDAQGYQGGDPHQMQPTQNQQQQQQQNQP